MRPLVLLALLCALAGCCTHSATRPLTVAQAIAASTTRAGQRITVVGNYGGLHISRSCLETDHGVGGFRVGLLRNRSDNARPATEPRRRAG